MEAIALRLMPQLAGSAHYEFAAHKLLIVEFFHCAFGFLQRLHLNKCEPFGSVRVFIGYYLCVLDFAYSIEEFEQVALGGVVRQIPHV